MVRRELPVHLVVTTFRRGDKVYRQHLLRHSYREDGKVKNKTVANISRLPQYIIDVIASSLEGKKLSDIDDIDVVKSLPHGHVAAVRGVLISLKVETMVSSVPCRERDIVAGMIIQRIVKPASKLSTSRLVGTTTLASLCGIEDVKNFELYNALDWLYQRQAEVERKLVKKHVANGSLVLYDLSSSWMEGTHCPLSAFGYSRDRKKKVLQIEYGLLANKEGCPVAVEVFPGNTSDSATVAAQVEKITEKYGVKKVVLVGDRGMITQVQVDAFTKGGSIGWLTAMRHSQVRTLFESQRKNLLPFILAPEEEIVSEYTDEEKYPGERLIACRNVLVARKSKEDREGMCQTVDAALADIQKRVATPRSRCHSREKILLAVEKVFTKRYAGLRQLFTLDIGENSFSFSRNQEAFSRNEMVDGIFVLRTSVARSEMDTAMTLASYKSLACVESRFRHLKMDIDIRPVFHWKEERVRAHVFLCLLAEYVRWHMEKKLAPILFSDDTPDEREAPLHAAPPSDNARRKASTHALPDGTPVHSFSTLIADLATIVRTTLHVRNTPDNATFDRITLPSPTQEKALSLLGVKVT